MSSFIVKREHENYSEYQDFVIDLGPPQGNQRPVRVLESPAGEARGSFETPFTREEIRFFFAEDEATGGALRFLTPRLSKARLTAVHIGQKLFDAIFQGDVRDAFLRSLERVQARDQGLRLKIRVDPSDPEAARLHSLPWELLYRPGTRQFLARHRRTPVVRYLDVPESGEMPVTPRPLRILMILASPHGLSPLDLEGERDCVEKVWGEHEAVEVDFVPRDGLPHATLETLRRALLEKHYHVIHFMGHGDFEPETGRGVLHFEDDEGFSDAVDGENLAETLRDFDSLRLVTVNACRGAEAGDEEGFHPFAGVATALVRGGVPAVVAMQAPISDRAAIAFSQEFYHRLASGDPIDAAETEGRRAIGRPERTDEWGKPVLFLRSRNGRLFQPGSEAPPMRPGTWSWNPRGLALLAIGILGLALLAGLATLRVWYEPALRAATLMVAVTSAGLGAALAGRDPRHGRRLSHLIMRHPAVGAGLVAFALASALTSWRAGPDLLCTARCGSLGCAPSGIQRVLIGSFENHLTDISGAELPWANEARNFLIQKLRLIESLELIDTRSGLTDERSMRCVDVGIRGSLGRLGENLVLKAQLSHQGGLPFGEVEARGTPDVTGEAILGLQNQWTMRILDQFDLDIEDAVLTKILKTPTLVPNALEHNFQGALSFMEGDLYKAALHFEEARDRDPRYADPVNNLGRLRLLQGEREAAIELFREAIELLPRHPTYHYNLGLALDKAGRLEEAVAAYEGALDLDSNYAAAYNNLGFVFLQIGDLKKARQTLEQGLVKAHREDQVHARLYKNLGRVALESGAIKEAVVRLGQALERLDPYPEALFYRALAFEHLKQQPAACRDWKTYDAVRESDEDPERRSLGHERTQQSCEEKA